ncbi:polysaccharide pyruvyl transferase family protein [Tsukamurella sp. 1534]|uniref:polysaccharide pyruvyl transferase family protein n=1 Tax=Tsukamurella sp. 1534 TaxID=1151061 RepID=UPI0002FB0A41|nr:polysaccharide pyruvyl transferase family protein [Tsukamurella sp. 1534]
MGERDWIGRLLRAAAADRWARRGIDLGERVLVRMEPPPEPEPQPAPEEPEPEPELLYLVSLAGHPNYGDELVLRTWLRHLARVRPEASVVVDVAHLGEAGLLFAGDHPHAVFVDTLWRLARFAADEPDELGGRTPQDWVALAATELGVAPGLAEGVDHLRRADSVHILGGGFVNALWPQWLPVVSAVAEVSRRTGARASASGLGLLPLPDGGDLARLRSDARGFAVFDVRDDASFAALDGVPGRSFTGDDVWLGTDPEPDTAPAGEDAGAGGGVALCIQSDLSEDFAWDGATGTEALAAFLVATLDAWDVPGDQVTVVEGIPGFDYTVPKLMGDRLDGARFVPFLDVWREGLPVGDGLTWISTRFHPHLVAAAAGDSGVAVVPKPDYYGIKHGSLVAAGSRWTMVDGAAAVPARPGAGGFPDADRRAAVARKNALAERLYPRR